MGAAAAILAFAAACGGASSPASPTRFTVTYISEGHNDGTAPPSHGTVFAPGATVSVLGSGDLVKDGYTHVGWVWGGADGDLYREGSAFNIQGHTRFYARWMPNAPAGTANTLVLRSTSPGAVGNNRIDGQNFSLGTEVYGYAPVAHQLVQIRPVGFNMPSDVVVTLVSGAEYFELGTNDPLNSGTLGSPYWLGDADHFSIPGIGWLWGAWRYFFIRPRQDMDARTVAPYSALITVETECGTRAAWVTMSFQVNRLPVPSAEFTVVPPITHAAPSSVATIAAPPVNFDYSNVVWSPARNQFQNRGVYTARVTLTAASANHTLEGITATGTTFYHLTDVQVSSDGMTAVFSRDYIAYNLLDFYMVSDSSGANPRPVEHGTDIWMSTTDVGYTDLWQYVMIRNNHPEATRAPLSVTILGGITFIGDGVPPPGLSLPPGGYEVFRVRPVDGLTRGSYYGNLTASGGGVTTQVGLSFTLQGLIYMISVQGGAVDMGVCLAGGDSGGIHTASPIVGRQQVPSFYMSRTPITAPEFAHIRNHFNDLNEPEQDRPIRHITAHNNANNHIPAAQISWYDAISFANFLSIYEGLDPVYVINGETDPRLWPKTPFNTGTAGAPVFELRRSPPSVTPVPVTETGNVAFPLWTEDFRARYAAWHGVVINHAANGYRIPTTVQWEFAAKGGRHNSPYHFSGSNTASDVAFFPGNPGGIQQVGALASPAFGGRQANALGIYHMSGSVQEFCWEWTPGAPTHRVMRGGAWNSPDISHLRVVNHQTRMPASTGGYVGIRLVRPSSAP